MSNYLLAVQYNNKSYDIFGPEILTYKEMLLQFGYVRGLKRRIITVPVMTPKLSSYWLYFVTSTSYKLATALVSSMTVEVLCRKSVTKRIDCCPENASILNNRPASVPT